MNRDDIARYAVMERLKDQRSVTIRAIRPSDKALIIEALRGLSADSIYFRLFAAKREFTDADLKEITEVDFAKVVALVAVLEQNGSRRIVGEARYIRSGETDAMEKAEVALLVDDTFHGLGVATRLLKHLISIAREAGITHFEAEVLRANQAMLTVLVRSGLPVTMTATREFVYALMDLRAEGQSPAVKHAEDSSAQGGVADLEAALK